ncbi:MAG TPA: hypothetical protein VF054_15500 [Micromonosporaceae bacterium]
MRPPRAALVPLIVVLALAGCGTHAVAPKSWVASVCRALTPWQQQIAQLTSQAQAAMAKATTPAETKTNLVRLLSGAEQASETARAKLAAAGVPDVQGGAVIAAEFTRSLAAVRDAYGKARRAVEALDPAMEASAFYDKVVAIWDTLNQEYSRSAVDTGKLSSTELRQAFDEVPECR